MDKGPVVGNATEMSCLDASPRSTGESEDRGHYTYHQSPNHKHKPGQPNFQGLEIGFGSQMLEFSTEFRFQDGHSLFEEIGVGHDLDILTLDEKGDWNPHQHNHIITLCYHQLNPISGQPTES